MRANAFGALLAVAMIPLAAQRVVAQRPIGELQIDSGKLVRVWSGAPRPSQGRLLQLLSPAAETIRYCRYPGPPCSGPGDSARVVSIRKDLVTRLDVKRGTNGFVGAIIGLAGGSILIGPEWPCETGDCANKHRRYVTAQAIGAAVGAFIGFSIADGSIRWGSPR